MNIKEFEIKPELSSKAQLVVKHHTETFDFVLNGSEVSIINNGDNSWSIVSGDLDQETANLIGDAIEKKLKESFE